MNINSKLYKTLSKDEVDSLNISIKRNYFYSSDNEIKEIKEKKFETSNSGKHVQLIDEDYEWNPAINNLYLDLKVTIQEVERIFGKNGSCGDDARIGIGLYWKAEKSKIKKCIKIGEFSKEDYFKSFTVDRIDLENISSNVTFYVFLYIAKPATKSVSPFFGNIEGMIIYQEIAWEIIVEGNSSIFPIFEIDNPKMPLWSYYCDVEDIDEDSFDSEHIKVLINKSHKAYELLHPKSDNYNPLFTNEVISSAIAAIILTIRMKQKGCKIDVEKEAERGTVSNALKYFQDVLNFDINGPFEDLNKSIKLYFDKEF